MKKLLLLLSALALTFGCYNDSDIREELREHEARLTTLETLCQQANSNIEALQTAVSALEKNVYVSAIVPVKKNGEVIGYAISFTNAETITIYHGQDGDKGEQGEKGNDGATPAVGLKQDADGIYYWTLNGEWLLDDSGKKVPASGKDGADGLPGASGPQGAAGKDGVTPQLKIEEGYWYVSYDGGKTWADEPLGTAGASDDEPIFTEVTYDTDFVYLTLADGEKLTLPRKTVDTGGESTNPATVTIAEITATTATFTGHLDVPASDLPFSKVTVYYSSETFNVNTAESESAITFDSEQNFTITLTTLGVGTKYNYCVVTEVKSEKIYGEINNFTTENIVVALSASDITAETAKITGIITGLSDVDKSEIDAIGIAYSTSSSSLNTSSSIKKSATLSSDGTFSISLEGLYTDTKYYYCSYVKQDGVYTYGEARSFATKEIVVPSGYINLSATATANSYIIPQSGSYCLLVARGNQSSSLLSMTRSASVLWESFGTDIAPSVGDLVRNVSYKDAYITFQTADTFKEGNAVIAAKDAAGNILWSWHIWLTDQPQGQEYYNGVGTMMDRNLGATSATPGDVGALGLLYQWGRKDPFLGSSSISSNTVAKSTISWPSPVSTNSSCGTVSYVVANPMTFVYSTTSSTNYDWHYSSRDNTLWTTSDKAKSIYDPCPAGWRVPDGGSNGIWSTSIGSSSSYTGTYDSTNEGMNFSGKFGSASPIWYPASGYRSDDDGGLYRVGLYGYYRSASPDSYYACYLYFDSYSNVRPSSYSFRACGFSVRCLQESK